MARDADATNTDRDRPHADVTVKDVPAFVGGIGRAAAVSSGLGAIRTPCAVVGNYPQKETAPAVSGTSKPTPVSFPMVAWHGPMAQWHGGTTPVKGKNITHFRYFTPEGREFVPWHT
jgi:hypothetical protein